MNIPMHLLRLPRQACVFLALVIAGGGIGSSAQAVTQSSTQASPQTPAQLQVDGLPFGRLFSTPAQRQQWDLNRQHPGRRMNVSDEASSPSSSKRGGQAQRLSGVILRADGQQTLWLNGQLQQQSNLAPSHTVLGGRQQSQTLRVRLGANGRALKPGQVWQPGNTQVQEAYQIPLPRPAPVSPEPTTQAESAEPISVAPLAPAASAPVLAKPAVPATPEEKSPAR